MGHGPHSSYLVNCVVLCIVCVDCVVLCTVCVYMCTVLLPPGGYPIAVKYIISYIIKQGNLILPSSKHISWSYYFRFLRNLGKFYQTSRRHIIGRKYSSWVMLQFASCLWSCTTDLLIVPSFVHRGAALLRQNRELHCESRDVRPLKNFGKDNSWDRQTMNTFFLLNNQYTAVLKRLD